MTLSKSLLVLAMTITISGCSFLEPRIEYVEKPIEVLVPVAAECEAPIEIKKPDLPIHKLVDSSKPDDVARAYVSTVIILNNHTEKLNAQLDAYRKKPE